MTFSIIKINIMTIQLVKGSKIHIYLNVTKHDTTCDPFLLLLLFYFGSFHVTYFIFMQYQCNCMHVGAEFVGMDTKVTLVLNQYF